MSKVTDKQVIVFSILFFALIYIAIHTNAIGDLFTVLRPFINGFILAYLTNIMAVRVEKKLPFKFARGLSILIVYFLFIGLLTVLLVYMIPILIQNVQLFFQTLPDYLGQSNLPNFDRLLGSLSLPELTPRLTSQLLGVTEYARAATSGVVNAILSFVVSVYVLLTKDAMFRFSHRVAKLLVPNHAEALREKLNKSHHVFQQFLFAQLAASLILGVLAGIVLSLLGVNYAVLIATIIGLSNIVPLVGAIIGIIVSVVILFLTNPPILALACFAFLLLLQQIDATIITPKLMGNMLNLNPIVVILVLAIGTAYFGIIGILFAIPITVMLREIVKEKLRES
ncbi:MAG: AI-2E family transporter [Turicibacter sp.]|nr:AI-2E family transporter [Turicibacter sp.]